MAFNVILVENSSFRIVFKSVRPILHEKYVTSAVGAENNELKACKDMSLLWIYSIGKHADITTLNPLRRLYAWIEELNWQRDIKESA